MMHEFVKRFTRGSYCLYEEMYMTSDIRILKSVDTMYLCSFICRNIVMLDA